MYSNKRKEDRGFNVFLKELKEGTQKNVLLFSGVESYLISWAAGNVKSKYVRTGMEMMDYAVLGENASAREIVEAASTFSMLSEKRVVWVRDWAFLAGAGSASSLAEKDMASLIEYINNPSDGSVLIFSHEKPDGRNSFVKTLKKCGSYYEFDTLEKKELISFAVKRFRAAGVAIGMAEMDLLIRLTGYYNKESEYRLYNFENDITKIIAHTQGGRVTPDDIEGVVSGEGDRFIFDLLDGISGNDKKTAFEILHNRLSQDSYQAVSLLASIASQMELLLIVREFMDRAGGRTSSYEISSYTKMNEYRIKKAMNYASRYSLEKLSSMLQDIYEANRQIVTGMLDGRTALELFVARI